MARVLWSCIAVGCIAAALAAFPYAPFSQLFHYKEEPRPCFPALFSFGSSIADTGNYGTIYPSGFCSSPLFGQTYFGKPSSRCSDGRLLIDFWAQFLNLPLLSPYLKAIGSNFAHGVNFACSGAMAGNTSFLNSYPLSVQLEHFKAFKRATLDAGQRGDLPSKDAFEKGLYIIAIGGNDLFYHLAMKRTVEEAKQHVPHISQAIVRVVEELYKEGARTILVEDVFPQGCTPNILSEAVLSNEDLDSTGCSRPHNDNVKLHNHLLKEAILDLNAQLKDASVIFVDTYSIRYGIIANASLYGFTEPIKACCGIGEKHNFNLTMFCGQSELTTNSCSNPKQHVNWDGIHFTDEFNHHTMSQILTEAYFFPKFPITKSCNPRKLHAGES